MDLNALALFAKVADAGSFSEAVRRATIPLASVSRRVAELEEELGVRLLERSTRKLRLTSIGGQLIALLAFALDSAVDNAWRLNDSVGGTATTVAFKPRFTIDSFSGLAAGLLAGSGIGELPPLLCEEFLEQGKLMAVLPRWRFDVTELVLPHRRNRHSPKAVQLFKDFALKMVPLMTNDPADDGTSLAIRHSALDVTRRLHRRIHAIASIA